MSARIKQDHHHNGPSRSHHIQQRILQFGTSSILTEELLTFLLHFVDPTHRRTGCQLIQSLGTIGHIFSADPAKFREAGFKTDDLDDGNIIAFLLAVKEVMKRILYEKVERSTLLIDSHTSLLEYLHITCRYSCKEEIAILYLNKKNRLILEDRICSGTIDHAPIYPREVVKRALELNASAIILVHNHPSGDPTPSTADIEMTRAIKRALTTVDITLHDHIIIGGNDNVSFRNKNLL